jgi:hypothetical protein
MRIVASRPNAFNALGQQAAKRAWSFGRIRACFGCILLMVPCGSTVNT